VNALLALGLPLLGAAALLPPPCAARPGGAPAPRALAGEPAFLELATERRALYVGEVFALRAVLGFERGFRDEHLVPLFRQALELPVQLELPFAEGLDCAAALPLEAGPAAVAGGPRLVLGERVVRALPLGLVERDGRPFEAYALELRFRATCPGALELAGASLRYAEASGFRGDLFEGRVPLDARERSATAAPLALWVRSLPEEGRPPDFGGAVGELTVAASAEPRELTLGETLTVTLEVRGSGDLDGFERPRPSWPGFTLLGVTEERLPGARRIRFDLRPEGTGVDRVPALELPYFRPGPAPAYGRASSAPIPIRVHPAATPAPSSAEPPAPPAGGAAAELPREDGAGRPWWWLAGPLVAGPLLVAALLRRRRTASRRQPTPSPEARALAARLAAGEDPGGAWIDYLARRLGCSGPALVGTAVAERLVAAGHPAGPAARAAELLEQLVAARYGGPAPGDAAARARRTAAELEAPPA